MQVQIFKDANNLLHFNGQTVPSGSLSLIQVPSLNQVNFQSMIGVVAINANKDAKMYKDNLNIEDILREDGSSYETIADLMTECKDFFVNAPVEGGKWLTYKALLTQSLTAAPIARVLNQDESDYLGDVIFIRYDIGTYEAIKLNAFPIERTKITLGNSGNGDEFFDITFIDNNPSVTRSKDSFRFYVKNQIDNSTKDDLLYNTPIEIKVRQRGASPSLLRVETNLFGDEVNLVLNKDISKYGLLSDGFSGILTTEYGIKTISSSKNNILFNLYSPIQPSDEVSFLFDGSFPIESIDYGLLQPFENYPIINNVALPIGIDGIFQNPVVNGGISIQLITDVNHDSLIGSGLSGFSVYCESRIDAEDNFTLTIDSIEYVGGVESIFLNLIASDILPDAGEYKRSLIFTGSNPTIRGINGEALFPISEDDNINA